MRFGVHLPHIGRKAGPDSIKRAAVQAEQLGFSDVWASEHIIVPKDAPYPPSPSFFDPILTLTWAAAFTSKVRLGTTVLVLPMRHPLPLAKELSTLQCLSQGRVILGAGVGWLKEEYAALGVPFEERGKRMDEGIAMMRAVWNDDPVSFDAKTIPAVIQNMRMQPKPSTPIPVWVGGISDAAINRAIRIGDGWHGTRLKPDEVGPVVKRLRENRPEASFGTSMRVSWDGKDPGELRGRVEAYAKAGIDHAMLEPTERGIEEWLGAVERIWRAVQDIR